MVGHNYMGHNSCMVGNNFIRHNSCMVGQEDTEKRVLQQHMTVLQSERTWLCDERARLSIELGKATTPIK